jgi:hypothetical protein
MNDQEIKKEYLRSQGLISEYISPKKRKIHQAMHLMGHCYGYWDKMTSRQLGGMLLNKLDKSEISAKIGGSNQ